jgi:hypothetical protein
MVTHILGRFIYISVVDSFFMGIWLSVDGDMQSCDL